MAAGQDIGTAFLCSARQDSNNQIKTKSIRNAYMELDSEATSLKSMLSMSNMNVIEEGNRLWVIGENANVLAGIFKMPVNRPMQKGVLSHDVDAEKIMLKLLENVLGKANNPGEICCYSMPGTPLNGELDATYHSAIVEKLLGPSHLGYTPKPINEAAAVIFSNAAKEQFSAIGISFGGGMVNVCLMYKTVIGLSFSIIGSGDNIDAMAAQAVGTTPVRIQSLKEKGVDLMNPAGVGGEADKKYIREREAIAIYYRALILRVFNDLKNEFINSKKADFVLPEAIPIIIAGGTSLAKNFLELFKSSFETIKDKWPISISEIRMANDPLADIAKGCLVFALNSQSNK